MGVFKNSTISILNTGSLKKCGFTLAKYLVDVF